jgi:hypothetical protein
LSKEPEPLECDLEIPEKVVDAESRGSTTLSGDSHL